MSIIGRIKNIHPGVWIAAFFAILIAFNIAFFVIAASHDVQLVEPGDSYVMDPADGERSPLAPTDERVHR